MSKKKKKTGTAPDKASQNPEATKASGENPGNYISIEIPDRSEGKSPAAEPEEKAQSKPEENIEFNSAENPEEPAPQNIPTADKSEKDNPLEKAEVPDITDTENSENEISIELPDSEAEKLKTFTPQVTAAEKPPLTPEQREAKKHQRRIIVTKTANVVLLCVLALMGLLMILPFFFAIMQTVKTTAELGDVPYRFFPKDFTFKSFVSLFTSTGDVGVPFYRFIFNTVFVAAVVTFLRILVTVPAAYVLAKVKAPMIKTLNRIVEWSLALTPALAFTLNNAFMSKTWFADTYFAVILPFITSPLCLVLIRGAIRHIPDDSIAAARLEGCSHIMILRKFVIPQIRPIIAAVAILSLFEIGKISGGPLTFGETMDMLPAFMEQLSERGAAGEMYVLAFLMFIPVAALAVIFRKSILKTMTTAMLKDEV